MECIVGASGALATPFMQRQTYELVYGGGPDVIAAASMQPMGSAERHSDGWRVKGRWPLVSGAQEADWIGGLCVMKQEGKPLPNPSGDGTPWGQFVVLPAREWKIEDTWRSLGLKGTGSVHVSFSERVVSDAHMVDLLNGRALVSGALYQSPMHIIPLLQSAMAVGLAEGALDDLIELARGGWRQTRAVSDTIDSPYFQGEIGRVSGEVRAVRAMLSESTESHWRQLRAGNAHDKAVQARVTQAAIWIVKACVRCVDDCYSLGGSGVIYEASRLQRKLRDVRTASQHYFVQARHHVDVGRMLLNPA